MPRPAASPKQPISWRRNLYVISFAELVAVAGFTTLLPFLPLYVRVLGVQGEREVQLWAGIVIAVSSVTMAIFSPIWGALSDRHGRKLMVERAMFGGALVIGLMGAAQNVQQLTLLRLIQGAVTGVITAANVLVATTAPRERTGYALGMLQLALFIGASVGPLLGGLVADNFGYRATFWVTSALLFIAGLGVLIFVQEEFQPVAASAGRQSSTTGRGLSLWQRGRKRLAPLLQSTPLISILGLNVMMRLGSRLVGPVFPLFVESIAPAGARVASITGLISGVSAAAGAVGALWLGRLGDRVGYRRILVACALISAASYGPQFLVRSPFALLPLKAGAGFAMGGILTAISASLNMVAPEGQQGVVYGAASSARSIANGIGPMVGSALAAWLGLGTPFLFATGLFVLAGIAAFQLMPKPKSASEPPPACDLV